MDDKIEHPHQEKDCQICWLIDNAIRPVIEFQTRKKISKEIESQVFQILGYSLLPKIRHSVSDCYYSRRDLIDFVKNRCIDIARGREDG